MFEGVKLAKMLILINTYILVIVSDSIRVSEFSLPAGSEDKNVIIFGVDMSSSLHIDNKTKDILVLRKNPTQGLDDTTLTEKLNIQLILQDQIENFV